VGDLHASSSGYCSHMRTVPKFLFAPAYSPTPTHPHTQLHPFSHKNNVETPGVVKPSPVSYLDASSSRYRSARVLSRFSRSRPFARAAGSLTSLPRSPPASRGTPPAPLRSPRSLSSRAPSASRARPRSLLSRRSRSPSASRRVTSLSRPERDAPTAVSLRSRADVRGVSASCSRSSAVRLRVRLIMRGPAGTSSYKDYEY
jgi:hypothetical protein